MLSAARRVIPLSARTLRPQLVRCTVTSPTTERFQFNPSEASKIAKPTHDHSTMFKLERYWAAAMVPLLPAAYFIHTPLMDNALAVAIALHVHWGLHGVLSDYGRPFVLGPALAKFVQGPLAYFLSISLLAGLLHFNMCDVGITKAFEMVWAL